MNLRMCKFLAMFVLLWTSSVSATVQVLYPSKNPYFDVMKMIAQPSSNHTNGNYSSPYQPPQHHPNPPQPPVNPTTPPIMGNPNQPSPPQPQPSMPTSGDQHMVCHAIWREIGTMCDPVKLLEYTTKIEKAVNETISEVQVTLNKTYAAANHLTSIPTYQPPIYSKMANMAPPPIPPMTPPSMPPMTPPSMPPMTPPSMPPMTYPQMPPMTLTSEVTKQNPSIQSSFLYNSPNGGQLNPSSKSDSSPEKEQGNSGMSTSSNTTPSILSRTQISSDSKITSMLQHPTFGGFATLSPLNNSLRNRALTTEQKAPTLKASNYQQSVAKVASIFVNETVVEESIKNMEKCWGYLKKARDIAICYTCLPNNEQYFHKGKAIVSEDDCNLMLGDCGSFFKDLILFVESASTLKPPEVKGNNWREKFEDKIKVIVKSMNKAEISSLFHKFSLESEKPKKQGFANELCARLFRLHRDPLFGLIGDLVAEVKTLFKKEKSEFENKLDDSYKKEKKRLLSLENLNDNPFSGDVVVYSNADNMFVAYDGSKGSTLENAGKKAAPMNLSLTFP